jgi:hypothetical protein
MFSPLKCMLRSSISICCQDAHGYAKTTLVVENLDILCDLELNFALSCILPMLKMGHTLIKYTQRRDVFICDFFDAMKLVEDKIYWLYVNPFCKYKDFAFFDFVVVCEHHCGQLPFVWVTHENKAIFYCLPIWHSILVIRSTGSIIMEVLRVFTFMCTTFMKLRCSTQ